MTNKCSPSDMRRHPDQRQVRVDRGPLPLPQQLLSLRERGHESRDGLDGEANFEHRKNLMIRNCMSDGLDQVLWTYGVRVDQVLSIGIIYPIQFDEHRLVEVIWSGRFAPFVNADKLT